ncbi:type III secretion system chaperone [Endozoicomonas sp. SM1973]|uniref:Type III secretion system chaperone n=1 Tax=Spartinivicinus marinus TaxID=2994442 RepID=A0A853HTT1_9GAMM|nr:type III secretion system chaperone [Spartinivicinus marinus]MCX4030072.1 type III secretion system chaperone [Spartinivicinus marinus]NYZ64683.1 type III secretion system chaperone [Spartinivicinus marinus]
MNAEVRLRIKTLLNMLGMGDVELPNEPVVSLSIDDKLTINIGMTDNSQIITFFSSVGKLVDGDFLQAKQLLSNNLFNAQFPPMLTAIDEMSNDIILWTQLNLGSTDDAELFQMLETYINKVEEQVQTIEIGSKPPVDQTQSSTMSTTFGVKV